MSARAASERSGDHGMNEQTDIARQSFKRDFFSAK